MIHTATSRFSPAVSSSTEAGAMPQNARTAATPAAMTIATALTTLLAATMRACCEGGERSWMTA